MAPLTRTLVPAAAAAAAAVAGCGDLRNFDGEVTPLATIRLEATGHFDSVRVEGGLDEALRVAIVWADQWLPEPMCVLPPESDEVAAVIVAGCRNPLAFTPRRVATSAPITPNEPTELPLFALPAADDMFGDVTARVGYASLVVFDDRDGDGTLDLGRPRRNVLGGGWGDPPGPPDDDDRLLERDIIYGASLVAMTEPDTRIAFREGAFITTGFYPRAGCGDPPPAFSILSAGGFSFEAALAATLAGRLPAQDPATCAEARPEDTTVAIPLRPPAELHEVGCEQRRSDSSVRYRQPPADPPDLTPHVHACAGIPRFGDEPPSSLVQLLVASHPDDRCRTITHFVLRGCHDGGIVCDTPEWDFTATPPAWWPCPLTAP